MTTLASATGNFRNDVLISATNRVAAGSRHIRPLKDEGCHAEQTEHSPYDLQLYKPNLIVTDCVD